MPEVVEVEVSPERNFVLKRVLLVNLLEEPMTWTFTFDQSSELYAKDSWYTVAPLQNETDKSATRYSPANTSFSGKLLRYQFFDIVVSAVEDLAQLPLNNRTDRTCTVRIIHPNATRNINFTLPLEFEVRHTAGRASASQSLLSATVCPASSNCSSISAAEPLTVPIPALTEMRWTLSTRDELGHSRDKSDEAKVSVYCQDEAGFEHNGTDSKPYGACIIKEPSDEKNGNYTFVLTPLRTGKLTLIVRIGNETVSQASHMTFEVSKPICPPILTVLSEAEEDIREPCVCAIGTTRLVAGKSGSSQCELCPAGTFTLEQGAPECEVCPKEARCLSGAEVLNAAGFWLDLQCIADGIKRLSLSRKTVFAREQCPIMKCPGGKTACAEPNQTSLFAQELSGLYRLLPSAAGSNTSEPSVMRADSLHMSESTNATLPQITSLQCNEGYEGRLCASCSKGYGLQVRPCARFSFPSRRSQPADRDACREKFAKRAPMP
jgi:hypothetical protein